MSDPKVLNAPERIWLVYGEAGYDIEHSEVDPEDVCWSHQSEFPTDVGYVRSDVHEAEVERLRGLVHEAYVDGFLQHSVDFHYQAAPPNAELAWEVSDARAALVREGDGDA